jgi:phage tail sheath protein FI
MPEYLSPGVYAEEVEIGGQPIEGVSTSTAGFVGMTERGPGGAQLVTGLEEYRRIYGQQSWIANGQPSTSTLPYAIDGFFQNGGKRCFIARVTGQNAKTATLDLSGAAERPPDIMGPQPIPAASAVFARISAVGPGVWGNRIFVAITDSSLGRDKAPGRFRLRITYKDDNGKEALQELFDDLSPRPDHPSIYERMVNGMSSLIRMERAPNAAIPGSVALIQPGADSPLIQGADGDVPSLEDYQGRENTPGNRSGLGALASVDEISILCAPDSQITLGLTDAVVEQCELLADRFAVVTTSFEDRLDVTNLEPRSGVGSDRKRIDSKYAAYYGPWVKIIDGTGAVRSIPPAGHVVGVYARSDNERGVFKAPANEVVRGIVGLDHDYTKAEQDILNPRGVNCIRALPGRGLRIWGARTTSSETLWRYVNVRRLFIFIEESINHGTQWVVFEPNDERLWGRVQQTISDFLTNVWRSGALMGTTAAEAFFVKCDATTMTQNDLMTGRLVVIVGVAASRPAEFVIFRIAQWTRDSSAAA